MNPQTGTMYVNKTWKFLAPCLKGHGVEFTEKFNNIFKMATGIHDTLLDGSVAANGRNVYLLCNSEFKGDEFKDTLIWLKDKEYFVNDYCPDVKSKVRHMIVVRVPEKYNHAYDSFLKSQYSKMYSDEQIKFLFSSDKRIDHKNVLLKNPDAAIDLAITIEKQFGEEKSIDDVLNYDEYELPLIRKEEIFDYDNMLEKDRVFFNEEFDKVWQT